MKTLQPLLAVGSFLFGSFALAATITEIEATGFQPSVVSPQGNRHQLYTESHALLISASAYQGGTQSGWRSLPATHQELDQLAEVLRRHGFSVTRVKDPTGEELFRVLRDFSAAFGRTADSRFLIMFSGHGYTNPVNQMGYLVPIDAPNPQSSPQLFYRKAVPIRQLELIAAEIESRHGLFLFDSCFSGSIFARRSELTRPDSRGNSPSDRWRFLTGKAREPVRQFIAAGGADQELPGRSVFLPLLIKALEGTAVISKDGYLSGKEIGLWLEQQVPTINPSQNPRSDLIRDPGLVFGDMIFQLSVESPPQLGSNRDSQSPFQGIPAAAEPQISGRSPETSPHSASKVVPEPPVSALPASDDIAWGWPTTGQLKDNFDAVNNKGISISGKRGQEILAAADGRVVYAGSGLRGYGNLLIIKHNNTYLTSYAHNEKVLVKEGEVVKRGQLIARMGSTDSDVVKLYFEIRRQGKPVNPLEFLPAQN